MKRKEIEKASNKELRELAENHNVRYLGIGIDKLRANLIERLCIPGRPRIHPVDVTPTVARPASERKTPGVKPKETSLTQMRNKHRKFLIEMGLVTKVNKRFTYDETAIYELAQSIVGKKTVKTPKTTPERRTVSSPV